MNILAISEEGKTLSFVFAGIIDKTNADDYVETALTRFSKGQYESVIFDFSETEGVDERGAFGLEEISTRILSSETKVKIKDISDKVRNEIKSFGVRFPV